MKTKTCSKCGQEKPLNNIYFVVRKNRPCGYSSYCRQCERERGNKYRKNLRQNKEYCAKEKVYNHNWHLENRERVLERKRIWTKNNLDLCNAKGARRRATKLNQTPDLSQDEKLQISEIYKKAHEAGHDWQVDHIVPLSRGGLHHPDNLQIVLKSYNLHKQGKLESEFRPPLPFERYLK